MTCDCNNKTVVGQVLVARLSQIIIELRISEGWSQYIRHMKFKGAYYRGYTVRLRMQTVC